MFESLESRRLFTSVSLTGGVLTVNGGASDDLITVSEDQGAVHVEWSTATSDLNTADYNGVTAININGGRGDDAIYYQGNSIGANIHGDGATDNSGGNGNGNGNGNNGHHDRDCDFRGGRDRHHISWHQEIFNKCRGNNGRGGGLLGLLMNLINKFKGNDNNNGGGNGGGNGSGSGTDGDDQITVTDVGVGSSTLDGDGGNDSLTVVVGNSTHVLGGAGNDNIYLNTGDPDFYNMAAASTIVDGEDGNDTFTTYAGTNNINGGKGKDTLINMGGNNTYINVESIV